MALAGTAPTLQDSLARLLSKASKPKELAYAGDVTPQDAFDYISSHNAVLADVRTPEEWQVGIPDLKDAPGNLLTLAWKLSPNYDLNPDFAPQFAAQGINKDTPVFFMCRSGGRSLAAALAMTQAGYENCFNISGGFEGKPDRQGWKSTLPWKKG